jgi:hypothetical protein
MEQIMPQSISSGYRLFSFREGDRSEYLAIYALTRIAYVTPVPRQEDFGVIDFRCVLTQKQNKNVVPGGAFCVQVKSTFPKRALKRSHVRWISTNMDSPLFICTVDKKDNHVRIFSCINIWSALFLRMDPLSITLVPNKTGPNGAAYVHQPGNTGDKLEDREGHFDVYVGPPVIDMSLEDFDKKSTHIFEILDKWIKLDRVNVAFMRLGRAAAFECEPTRPNEHTLVPRLKIYNRTVNQHGLIDKICPLLKSLQDSYARCNVPERANMIQELIHSLESDIDALERSGKEKRTHLERLLA